MIPVQDMCYFRDGREIWHQLPFDTSPLYSVTP